MSLEFRTLTGAEVTAALDDLARLRIEVFRDFPYLYDGSQDYERRYLARYADSPGSVLVAALDARQIVGVATGTPMEDHAEEFAAAFAGTGLELGEIFYCAESVLLPAYRGLGAGHAFFEARETHARRLGRRLSAFCAVIRPADHPLRPADYSPLDPFWRRRGYQPLPGVVARFSWTDHGASEASDKPMQFWLRRLD